MAAGLMEDADTPGGRPEIIVGVFRVDPAFDGMSLGLVVKAADAIPRSYFYLFFYQIEVDHFFRYAMFHLDTGVHFHEKEVAVFVDQEFYRADAFVVDGGGGLDSGVAHAAA